MEEIKITLSVAFTSTGLIGNSMVIFILSRPKFRKESLFRYLLIATIVDSIYLFTIWPFSYHEELNTTIEIMCKLGPYITRIIYQLSPWIMITSSLDRYIATKYPTEFMFRKEFKYQALAIIIILFSITFINIPYFYFFKIVRINSNETSCQFENFTTFFYMDLSDALISTIIPFLLMSLFNLLTYKALLKSKKINLRRKKYYKESRFFKVILLMNIFFLTCNFPIFIYVETYDVLGISYFGRPVFFYLTYLTFLYSSLNFFVYFFSNKLFRRYFSAIVCLCRKNKTEVVVLNNSLEPKAVARVRPVKVTSKF
jgi:hypothetical protein